MDVVTFGIPTLFWLIFLFALGAAAGSFLNVVVYRMPRDLSIVRPGSHCTVCKHPIAWYDNIPIAAWFILGGKCRHCGARFSVRYAVVEFLTAILFVGLFWFYFVDPTRSPRQMPVFESGGWMIYMGHIALVAVLLAASLIDAEHWIIPLSLCYTIVAMGAILSMVWPYVVEGPVDQFWRLIPWSGPTTASLAIGALGGLSVSLVLVQCGIIKRSFDAEDVATPVGVTAVKDAEAGGSDDNVNVRAEMVREMVFLAPPLLLALAGYFIFVRCDGPADWWAGLLGGHKWFAGLLGSAYGFMIGGAVVWATRIAGTLAFGREAMGLGDVHLMAAVGAVLGWISPTIAFFLAPFFGLGWAVARLIIHRSREIPYGPFLSMATLVVMIFQDRIVDYLMQSMVGPSVLGP
jgi:leader peptidase (prepilin peptidase) / N-methyltransferase